MWWLIAWAIISLIMFGVLAMLALSVPSTERAGRGDLAILGGISIGAAGLFLAVLYAATAVFQGIF